MKDKTIFIISRHLSPSIGGMQTHIDDMTRECLKRKYHVILASRSFGINNTKKNHKDISSVKVYGRTSKDEKLLQGIRDYIKQKHISEAVEKTTFSYLVSKSVIDSTLIMSRHRKSTRLIHAHDIAPLFAANALYKIFHTPYVATLHTYSLFEGAKKNKLFIDAMNNASAVFTSSRVIFKELKDNFSGKVIFFTQWINLQVFHPIQTERKRVRNNPSNIKILIIGRSSDEKMFYEAINALSRRKDTDLTLIGEGFDAERIRKNFVKARIILGMDNKKLNKYYNEADYTIIPNIISGNIPRTGMESLASGTPLLMVLPENRGFMPWLKDMKEKKIVSSLKDMRKKDTRTIKLCRAYAEKNFSRKNSKVIFKEYNRIIKEK